MSEQEPRSWKGVRFKDSVKASGLAEEIVNHFAVEVPKIMSMRSGIVTEVEHEELSDDFIKEISQDLTEVLTGRDSGCLNPEDLDATNCSMAWVEDKLQELLESAAVPTLTLEQARHEEAKDWLVIVESLCKGKLRYATVRRTLAECRQRVADLDALREAFTKAAKPSPRPRNELRELQ
jgi:hypothetical protein